MKNNKKDDYSMIWKIPLIIIAIIIGLISLYFYYLYAHVTQSNYNSARKLDSNYLFK